MDTETQIGRHERRHAIKEQIVKFGSGLTSDLNGVLESGCGHQCHASALTLQQCVRAYRSAMQEGNRIRWTNFSYNFDDGVRRVGGGGEYFQHPNSAAFYPNAIGKRASGIDCDTKMRGLRRARHSGGERYSST